MKTCLIRLICVASLLALATTGFAASIGVNFVGGGDTLAATDQPGVVPQANWNNAAGGTGAIANLVDSTGSNTGVSVAWSAGATFNAHQENNTDQFSNNFDALLMSGYLDNFNGTTGTITISNLTAPSYEVLVYDLESVNGRGGSITVAGTNSVTQSHTAATSTAYVLGTNYSDYLAIVPNAGTITITTDGSSFRIAEQGFQLIPVPEPASLTLVAFGALGLSLAALRRRK